MKRLLALISNSARLIAENQAIKNQAESATRAANALIESQSGDDKSKERRKSESNQEVTEILKLKSEELDTVKSTLKSKIIDLEVMKKQAESLAKEYDNLLKEHAKVTAKLEKFEYEHEGDAKKSN
jgi:small-conductance mechanosensitive channel